MKVKDSSGRSLVRRESWFPKERPRFRDDKRKIISTAKAPELSKGRFSNRSLFVHYYRCPYLYFLTYKARVRPVFNQYSELYRLAGYIYHELMDQKFKRGWSWAELLRVGMDRAVIHPAVTRAAKKAGGFFSAHIEEKLKERVMQGLLLTSKSKYLNILESGIESETEAVRVMLGAHFYCRIDLLGRENGNRFILDYKLSKFKSLDPEQLLYYSFMVPASYGYYYYVFSDTLVKVSFDREARRRVLETINKIIEGINREDYTPDHSHCSHCYLKDKCGHRVKGRR